MSSLHAWAACVFVGLSLGCAPPPPAPAPQPALPSATVLPLASARPEEGLQAPRRGAARTSPYCTSGLAPPCDCATLASLSSAPGGFTPEELSLAAERFGVLVPSAVAGAPSCIAPVGGKVYCRADVGGPTSAELPDPLDAGQVCTQRGRCASLRFASMRLCPRAGGGVTAWAEAQGLSELWSDPEHAPAPGATE